MNHDPASDPQRTVRSILNNKRNEVSVALLRCLVVHDPDLSLAYCFLW